MKRVLCFILALVLLVGASASGFADPSASEPEPTPFVPENGELIVAPDYEGSCEIKVKAEKDTDFYVYLQYIGESESSYSSRELSGEAEPPYESDLAFFVKAGQWVRKKIPVGRYQFYYATGSDFLGKEELFGDTTNCYSADELLDFYTNEKGHYIQYTIEFYKLSDDYRTAVPREDFPMGARPETADSESK